MKKFIILTIAIVVLALFSLSVYYGLKHSRGVPVKIEEAARAGIEAPFIDRDIDLSKDIGSPLWEEMEPQKIDLVYQVMILPWPKPRNTLPPVMVKAFHNKDDIYFYLSWRDDTEDRLLKTNTFSDACAIMFPIGEEVQPRSIMMGFMGAANIWQWKASQDREYWGGKELLTQAYSDYYYPFEDDETLPVSKAVPRSAVNDLMAIRIGTVTPKELQNVTGRGFFKDGKWQVVFKRSLKAVSPEEDASFNRGGKWCAFAVWDGARGDRGGRKSISDWVELRVH